jgi:hypothetical protein
MTGDDRNQQIEPGVMLLGAAYAAAFLALIVWMSI